AGIALSPKDILEEMSRQNKWKVMETQAVQGTSQGTGTMRTAKGAETGKIQPEKAVEGSRTGKGAPEGLAERERQVWELLDTRPQSAQELYDRLYEDMREKAPGMSELTDILLKLILGGWAEWGRGSTYVRTWK
ncbi:MAG: hypothetical protein ACI4SZ_04785, partial [Lachnospiraceae bacterium]